LGCDYLPTLDRVGLVKSYDYIIKHKSLEEIFKVVEQPENYNYEEVRNDLCKSKGMILIHPAMRCSEEKVKSILWEGKGG
jgi:5'-3' exonuclease